MNTVLTTDPNEAAVFIRSGGIVAFPTETVYGLGADVFGEAAIARIFTAKQRPADNPLIAHVSDLAQVNMLAAEIPDFAGKLISRFFPGPLTLVLRKQPEVPAVATAGLDSVGVRMPGNDTARAFLKACGTPIVAPSANLSGRPSPTTWQAVFEDLNGRIDCILQGDPTEIGLESTVVDCTGDAPVILRQGAVTREQIEAVVGPVKITDIGGSETPKSPGMRHKHYSPRANVLLVGSGESMDGGAFIGLHEPPNIRGDMFVRICSSVDQYAHDLFEFFRECDRRGVETIYCETVAETGVGGALMDRVRRAAES